MLSRTLKMRAAITEKDVIRCKNQLKGTGFWKSGHQKASGTIIIKNIMILDKCVLMAPFISIIFQVIMEVFGEILSQIFMKRKKAECVLNV